MPTPTVGRRAGFTQQGTDKETLCSSENRPDT